MEFIDLKSQQALIREDIEARIKKVLDHGKYIFGPEIFELEETLAARIDVKHCLTVASGTDALLMSLMALEIGPGDEVITTPYTWISTAEVIALVGASPVFVDIQPDTWNLDPIQLAAAITSKSKAIIPVGIFGQPSNMAAINKIAKDSGDLPVIEDAAQSFGSTHHAKPSGSLSQIGCTSFFPSKPLGGYGDGGAIFTNDDELAKRMKAIRVHGQTGPNHFPYVGLTGRMDSIQAAVLLSKLTLFDDEIKKRNQIATRYSEILSTGNRDLILPVVADDNSSVWAQYTVLSNDREALKAKLANAEIPSVAYYSRPLHLQPVFEDLDYRSGDFPVAETVGSKCLSLPMNPYLAEEEIERVCSVISS